MILFLKNLTFTVLVPGTVAVLIPWRIVRGGSVVASSAVAASLLFLVGASIYGWCLWDFASFGRGTPAPIDAPKRLVIRGLYRYTRNPMYVGVLTTILGWSVLFRDLDVLLYAVCVGTIFQLFVLIYEEPHLADTFGAEYAEYRSRVGRWLPRIRGSVGRGSEPR